MKSIIFDAGPIISLTMNNLLWTLKELKKIYEGKFYITKKVRKELIDIPLETKKYKFEALQILSLLKENVLEISESSQIDNLTIQLLEKANHTFKAYGHWINIVHFGEISALAAAIILGSEAIVIDERTTRLLIENQKKLEEILTHKLHTKIFTDRNNLDQIKSMSGKLRVIRSVELAAIAYEHGILDKYLADIPNPEKTLLESVLWGVKISGCAVSKDEIDEMMRIEGK